MRHTLIQNCIHVELTHVFDVKRGQYPPEIWKKIAIVWNVGIPEDDENILERK